MMFADDALYLADDALYLDPVPPFYHKRQTAQGKAKGKGKKGKDKGKGAGKKGTGPDWGLKNWFRLDPEDRSGFVWKILSNPMTYGIFTYLKPMKINQM